MLPKSKISVFIIVNVEFLWYYIVKEVLFLKKVSLDKKKVISFLLPIISVIYFELTIHFLTFSSINVRTLIPVLFAIPCGIAIYFFSTFFRAKTNMVIYFIFVIILTIYFIAQFVYYSIFGSFLSVFQVTMGADAVTNFFDQMLYGISRVIIAILLFLVPLIATIILKKKKLIEFVRPTLKKKLLTIPVIAAAHLVCLAALTVGGTGAYSAFDIYFDKGLGTDITVENLGIVTSTRLELTNIIFPDVYSEGRIKIIGINVDAEGKTIKNNNGSKDKPETPMISSPKKDDRNPVLIGENSIPINIIETPDEPEPTPETHNMMDIDFEDMINHETNADIITLHRYAMSRTPTKKNEYTGYFKNHNLIMLCAESFSPELIDKNITPTLYRLTHEGFIFKNYYGSYESNTTNGEYSLCMGMFPDLSRDKTDNSFIASANNYLPFVMGHEFQRNYGSYPYAFHDYYGTYYHRNITHPNMGYDFIAPDSGLDIDVSWPSSDLEMMEASVDLYIHDTLPFHAYYMTFSGHYQYNWVNPMSARNKDIVMTKNYESETVQAYVACNIELEKALTYLIERLEEEGVLDNTVIVLTNDHYPYGLSKTEYNELAGREIDTQFEKYHNSFICWNAKMDHPVYVYEPCCTIDILPTLLNLFGFEYDSRLICGLDVLSDAEHIAILANQSFITDEMKFSSSNNVVTSVKPDVELDEQKIVETKNYVKNIFTVSSGILNRNYYAKFDYLFGDDVDPYDDYGQEKPPTSQADDTGEVTEYAEIKPEPNS